MKNNSKNINKCICEEKNCNNDCNCGCKKENELFCSNCKNRKLKSLNKNNFNQNEKNNRNLNKEKNLFLKVIIYFLSILGLIEDTHHINNHTGHDHNHTFVLKKWILILGTFLGTMSFIFMFSNIFGWFNVNDWIQLLMGIVAFIIMGLSFLKGSYLTIIEKEIAEDTLVAIATTFAFIYSVFAFIFNMSTNSELPYFFFEMIEILWLIYLGRFLEEWLTHKVSKDMEALQSLTPKKAILLKGEKEIEIETSDIKIGDILFVKTGSKIPVDGVVLEGVTTIDESSLTGESIPIKKEVGSHVFSGTISSNNSIKIEAKSDLKNSFISKIINSVNEAAKTKPKTQKIADKIAGWLVPSVLVISIITFITTGLLFSLSSLNVPSQFVNMSNSDNAWLYSFYIFITILVIACPCSFAMTTPMSVLVASMTSKKDSVILSSNTLFEKVKDVNIICFDKTGTLTEGKFKVVEHNIKNEYINELVSIENKSNHPLAKSIVNYFDKYKPLDIVVKENIGKGMSSSKMNVGSLKWLKEFHPNYKETEELISKRNKGFAIIYLFNKTKIIGNIILSDQIKSSALESLSKIRNLGIEVMMITGDNKITAKNIGSQLGIKEENIFSEVNPYEKGKIIKNLQNSGNVVSFVGDGINDSVALTQSDLGIAIGQGSDVAIEAADIVLNDLDLNLVPYSIWLSRKTIFTIKRGFTIAIIYNALMIPLAATGVIGLTGAGPAIASTSMVFNDSIAMINALTLKNKSKNKFIKKNNKS